MRPSLWGMCQDFLLGTLAVIIIVGLLFATVRVWYVIGVGIIQAIRQFVGG